MKTTHDVPHQVLEGTTWHVRHLPSKHRFSYPYRYWGLNLNKLANNSLADSLKNSSYIARKNTNHKYSLPYFVVRQLITPLKYRIFSALFSDKKSAIHSFNYEDYLDSSCLDKSNQENAEYMHKKNNTDTQPSKNTTKTWIYKVNKELKRLTGSTPTGDILALVVSRNFGFYFSPVNFYLGFNDTGTVSHLLAEVSNTPWKKSHYYGFHLDDYNNGDIFEFSHNKGFHVSPFNPLDQVYTWKVKVTESSTVGCFDIKLSINVSDKRGKVFAAGINMQSKPLTINNIKDSVRQNPIMNYSSMARIYWHALLLYTRKKVPYVGYNQVLKNSRQQSKPYCTSQLKGVDTMTALKKKPTERNHTTVLGKITSTPVFLPISNQVNSSINVACKHLLHKLLADFQFGKITLIETYNDKKARIFGTKDISVLDKKSGEIAGSHLLAVTIKIHNPMFYQKVIIGGSIALADSYIDGDWDVDDLTAFIRLGARNISVINQVESKFSKFSKMIEKNKHKLRHNSERNSKSNILAHYDLGNEMYQKFLDDSMMYSSALYETPCTPLADAQQRKLKTLCEQLELTADDTVIEIGTGWGGFAIYAATHYGCHVTTTTISDAQYDEAKRRVAHAGLNDKITLLKQDYRNLTGQYDKLISIEMVEAVGYEYLPIFFNKCNELLKDNGIMTMQAITLNDQNYKKYLNSVDFIQSHIFPGGCLLSNQEVIQQFTQETDMVVKSLIDYGYDYAYTLRDWRNAFIRHTDDIQAMGYDDSFIRLWHFYFAFCEGGFLEKTIGVVQVKAVKPAYR